MVIKKIIIEKTVLFHGALQWEAIPRATPKNWLPCHFTLLQLRAIPPAKIGLGHFCGQIWHGKWPLPLLPHQISLHLQLPNQEQKISKVKKKEKENQIIEKAMVNSIDIPIDIRLS